MAKGKEAANLPAAQATGGAVAVYDYGADSQGGFENQTNQDYAIPFLGLAQSNTPQVAEGKGSFKPGVLFNTVTEEVFDEVEFIPCTTQHVYVEWKPRDAGGGLVAIHQLDSDVVKQAVEKQSFGKIILENGNELIETFYVYGGRVTEIGGFDGMVISASSTKIKKYKGWMTKARAVQIALPDGRKITPPLWAHSYKIGSCDDVNKKGQKFKNLDIGFAKGDAASSRHAPDSELYMAAKQFKEMVDSGVAKADMNSAGKAGRDPEEEAAAGKAGGPAPF